MPVKKNLLLIIALLSTLILNGQGLDDAVRYSRQQFYGSARFNGMAGAFNALGGEMGANHLNPASIGVFKKNEMSFTLGISDRVSKGEYYGTNSRAEQARLNINNMGAVFIRELSSGNWKTLNVSISYTRKNDFNEHLKYSGNQSEHSFADHLAASAFGASPNQMATGSYQFVEFPAYQAYIIDPLDTLTWSYFGAVAPGEDKRQQGDIIRRGRMSETMLGLGANYNDRFYFGGGIHMASIIFNEENRFQEIPEEPTDIAQYRYTRLLQVQGTGFSFSGGIIARLTDLIRWGVSIQTPTYFVNDEAFSTSASSKFLDLFSAEYTSPEGIYRYNFNTPLRLNSGLAVVLWQNGLISAEYEFLDFGSAKFKENRVIRGYDYAFENEEIQLYLSATHNVRAGFEYRLKPVTVRAGYSFQQSPVKKAFSGVNRDIHLISLGLGTRYKHWLFDVAYQYNFQESQYFQYDNGLNLPATFNLSQHSISLSAGLRF